MPAGRSTPGEILSDDVNLSAMPRCVSNAASMNARRAGLARLMEQIGDWCRRGEFTDEVSLRAKFVAAHDALPKAESLRDVLDRDARGRYMGRIVGVEPPAA
jgi:hypothetical protein